MTKVECDELLSNISTIPGNLSRTEACALFEMAKLVPKDQAIVEIGSWKGKSTVCLASGSKHGNSARIHAIDPHTGSPDHLRHGKPVWTFDIFKENIERAGVSEFVEPILSTGEKAARDWNKPISLVFIDAEYESYDGTKRLVELWLSILPVGGVMALHNTLPNFGAIFSGIPLHGCKPVVRFMRRNIYPRCDISVIARGGSISFIKKFPHSSFITCLNNIFRLTQSHTLFVIHSLYIAGTRLPQPLKKFIKYLFGL